MLKKFLVFLLSLGLLFSGVPSYAAYAQLKPPPGWSQGLSAAVPGKVGTFAFGAAANGSSFKGTTVLTNAALSVAGQYVVVPVGMRVAANAASEAAAYSFGNPLLFAAVLGAPIAYQWFKNSDFEVKNGIWQVKQIEQSCVNGTCYQYSLDGNSWGSVGEKCAEALVPFQGGEWPKYSGEGSQGSGASVQCKIRKTDFDGATDVFTVPLSSRTVPPTSGETYRPATKEEFVSKMAPLNIPDDLPLELPNFPVPIQLPVLNPNPAVSPLPAPSPAQAPRPLWVPTGNPVPASPATSPQTYTQPGQNVVGAPTSTDPWRVDVSPLPITKTNATPNTGPVTAPEPVAPAEPLDIETCGLPGKPKCLIDEAGTPADKAQTFEAPKTELDTVKNDISTQINTAQDIQAPSWSFSFQFPTGCTPFVTGIAGVELDICKFQPMIHDLMAMIWAATTTFCIIGMVGRTIRES